MTAELLPCPFCGAPAARVFGGPAVACPVCDATVEALSDTAAVAAWNRRASGWISVEERLPDFGEDVMLFFPGWEGRGELPYAFGRRFRFAGSERYGWQDDESTLNGVATHWQPLPPPPGEGDK